MAKSSRCDVCASAEYNMIPEMMILSRVPRTFQNPMKMIVADIRKDANMSGIKKLMKNETGVTIKIADVRPTNVKNDRPEHVITSV